MQRVLVTGIEGFTGKHLAKELSDAGYEVYGVTVAPNLASMDNVKALYTCDLCDSAGMHDVVNVVKPNYVVHLAAIAFVGHNDVDAIYRTNIVGTRNLLEALKQDGLNVQMVLLASSANIYGSATAGVLDESAVAAPANDYAVSKLAMEYMVKLYMDKLPITMVRPFNYTGLGQSDSFLLAKITSHVRNKAPVLELGNLEVERDFSDVRTVVYCYRRLLQTPAAKGQVFNVCSGVPYSLQDVLQLVKNLSGHNFEVRVNPAFVRPNEIKTLVGNKSKLESVIGPLPRIPLADTLSWMLGLYDTNGEAGAA